MNPLKKAIYNLPLARSIYRTPVGRFLYHLREEIALTLSGKRNPMIPPKWKVYTGRGDYLSIAREFTGHFRALGGLQPNHAVLDVGCGIGRMAVGLTEYLSPQGRYEGFDVVSQGIAWCRERITPRFPNFNFQRVDIKSDLYNPSGRTAPEDLRFPYADATFDFVFLTSVFTHMGPDAVRNYLSEIARVLKPGGTSFITWYVYDDEARRNIQAGRSTLDFHTELPDCLPLDPKRPDLDVAFRAEWIALEYRRRGLAIVPPIHFGSWSGRTPFLSTQDIVIARKE